LTVNILAKSNFHSWEKSYETIDFKLLDSEPRLITKSGNGAAIGVPKEHLGKRAIIIILE